MHVTFLVTPGHGHLNPTLGVVAELTARGHRVSYPVPAAFVSAVEAVGAEPVRYESPLHQTMPGPPRQLTGSFFTSFQLRLLEESLAVVPALEKHLDGEPPDLISFDSMGPFGARVLAHAWQCPLVAMTPSLVSNEHFSLWPTFTERGASAPAEDDPVIIETRARFAAFATAYGVPADQVAAMGMAFAPGDEPLIVFVPAWFQPAADTFDSRYTFVGPCLTERVHQGGWQPSGPGPVQVVMSIGTRIVPADLGVLPGNVIAAPQVPQLQVLRHASAFISHGGMGSTMEALYHGVPLVMVPQMPEQLANARRVAELGLGRMLRPEDITAVTLNATVCELAADDPTRARLAELSRAMHAAHGAALAADTMEAHATRLPG